MYAGEIVEQADVRTIFKDPRHPYTRGLLGAVPVPARVARRAGDDPGQRAQPHRPACRLSVRPALHDAGRDRQPPRGDGAPGAPPCHREGMTYAAGCITPGTAPVRPETGRFTDAGARARDHGDAA